MSMPSALPSLLSHYRNHAICHRLLELLEAGQTKFVASTCLDTKRAYEVWEARSHYDHNIDPPPFYGFDETVRNLRESNYAEVCIHGFDSDQADFTMFTDINLTSIIGIIVTVYSDRFEELRRISKSEE